MFDEESRQWYIHPSRQETMELPAETYRVIAFACYKGTTLNRPLARSMRFPMRKT